MSSTEYRLGKMYSKDITQKAKKKLRILNICVFSIDGSKQERWAIDAMRKQLASTAKTTNDKGRG